MEPSTLNKSYWRCRNHINVRITSKYNISDFITSS